MIRYLAHYQFPTSKTIPSAAFYIQNFKNMQSKVKQQEKRIEQLHWKNELVNKSTSNFADSIKIKISKLMKSSYQPIITVKLKNQLISQRKQLQRVVAELDAKWEEPRKEIARIRKQTAQEFLSKFIKLDEMIENIEGMSIESIELREGCMLTHHLLRSTLEKHGVEFYEPQLGADFNEELQETVDDQKLGRKIVKVCCKGWKIGDKIIKKSVVELGV